MLVSQSFLIWCSSSSSLLIAFNSGFGWAENRDREHNETIYVANSITSSVGWKEENGRIKIRYHESENEYRRNPTHKVSLLPMIDFSLRLDANLFVIVVVNWQLTWINAPKSKCVFHGLFAYTANQLVVWAVHYINYGSCEENTLVTIQSKSDHSYMDDILKSLSSYQPH